MRVILASFDLAALKKAFSPFNVLSEQTEGFLFSSKIVSRDIAISTTCFILSMVVS